MTTDRTLADVLVGRAAGLRRHAREALLLVVGSGVVGLSAQIAVPIGPVPVTLQTLAVLLIGAAFGARRGAAVLLLYLLEGAAGLPVFSAAAPGPFGPARLLGPTAGYLLAFPLAAFVVGWLIERGWDRRAASALLGLAAGDAIILALGSAWLGLYVGPRAAVSAGLLPFVAFDAVKLLLAAALLAAARRRIGGTG